MKQLIYNPKSILSDKTGNLMMQMRRLFASILHRFLPPLSKPIIVFILLLFTISASADFVEVGGGTSGTSYVPVYGFYDYSWSRTVYLQSELGDAKTIQSIAYQLYTSPSGYLMPNQTIWMKHTTDATITSGAYQDPAANGFTKVYDGDIDFTGTIGDWFEVVFNTTNFYYNGTDNLLVVWENRDGAYASGYPRWYYQSTASRSTYKYADGSFPTTSGSISSYLPNTRFFYTPFTEGTMHGMVKNTATGAPIVGAAITATETTTMMEHTWMSDENGEYYFPILTGTYDLSFIKTGYTAAAEAGVVVLGGDTTEVPNVTMTETAYQPMFSTATVNAADNACLVEWGLPSGDYEIVYDDGLAENYIAWANASNMNAVKFTPAGYPALVKGGKVYVGDGTYPAGGAFLGIDFGIAVYDDNGANGMPGTILDSIAITPNDYGWVDFSGLNAEILEGDFYIAMVQGGNYPNCAPIGIDETAPQKFRSYSRNAVNGDAWSVSPYQDFMLRAIVEGPDAGAGDFASAKTIFPGKSNAMTSMNPVNASYGIEGKAVYSSVAGSATRGVDHYYVYRVSNFDPEDPMDPGVETLLNNNIIGLTYNDNGFGALASGYYRYNVYAVYESGEVSDASVSNIVGHALNYDIVVEIATTDGSSPEGAYVMLSGLEYPYEMYQAFAPASGVVVFEDVWDGTYDFSVVLNGFDPYEMMGMTIDEVMTIPVMLSETKVPARGLYVDPVTQVATWFPPEEFPAEEWTFDAGIPADFTIVNGGVCAATWEASTFNGGLNGTQMAFVNSDGAGSTCGTMDEQLITSVVNTGGVSELYIDFDQHFQQYGASIGDVDIWDGTAWQTVYSISSNIGGFGAPNHQHIDITAYANIGMKVRFHYYQADWSYWWAIDNVKVWDGVGGKGARELSSYNVYLDAALVGSTPADVLTWTYQNLTFGQTYIAGVAAIYSSGISEITTYEFTAAFLPPPRNLEGEAIGHDALLTWDFPLEGGPYFRLRSQQNRLNTNPMAEASPTISDIEILSKTRALFDLQFNYPATGGAASGEAGAECDGTYFYTTNWSSDDFYRYALDGTFLATFTISGVGSIRDLAYDGTYFYGAAANTDLFQMDFTAGAENLVSTITAAVATRGVAYNNTEDGFWANNWSTDFTLYSRTGASLSAFPVGVFGSYYGLAYDNFSPNGPFLWGFSQDGSGGMLVQYDIATGTETGLIHDVVSELGIAGDLAGGLFTQNGISDSCATIGGTIQNQCIFGYDLTLSNGDTTQTPEFQYFKVYRNNQYLGNYGADTSYLDIHAPTGLNEYSVTAVYYTQNAVESLEEGPISLFIDVSGHINGNVSVDYENYTPIEGAVVTAYKWQDNEWVFENETETDANGNYSLFAFENCYKVVCEATGFNSIDTFNICAYYLDTTYVDFILPENPLPVNWVIAERNFEHSQANISWSVPSNTYEIYYDNEVVSNQICWDYGGNQNALRFSPAGYPCKVFGGRVHIGDGSYPSGNNLQPFKMFLALADGENPGSLIDSIYIQPTNHNWIDFTFNQEVFINQGDFYLIMQQMGDYPNCTPIAIDTTSGANRSYSRNLLNGEDWQLSTYQDFMMRAVVYSPVDGLMMLRTQQELNAKSASTAHTHSLYHSVSRILKNQKQGKYTDRSGKNNRELEYYTIYRLNEGDEYDSSEWEMLANNLQNTEYTDLDWTTLSAGFYRYAVITEYSYSQSAASFSNTVPRLLDVEVTVNISTSSGDSPEGAIATLHGNESSYYYLAEAPENGITLLHEVWKDEWYTLTVSKAGYESFIVDNIFINQDLNLDVVLNEACLPPQEFNITMDGHATWLPPVLETEEVFFEGFEEGIIPADWTQITDPNMNPDMWTVQTGAPGGNPESAFEGEYNASFSGSSSITKLVTPAIDLSGAIAPELSFWFAQPASSGQDKLSVFYKNSNSGTWQALMAEAGDIDIWTQRTIDLPNPTATYCFAFEGTTPETGGEGIALDNVRVVQGVEPGKDRSVEGYNLSLDGNFIGYTEELNYDFDNLVAGQTYLAGLSAVYSHCESQKIYAAFIYNDCSYFDPITDLEGIVINTDVQLSWQPPDIEPQEYDIVYTDNTAENATAWNVVDSENALRMTPAGYPCDILSISVNIFDGTWPAGNILNPMEVLVYAGDDTGGLPGTLLGSKVVTPTGYNWVTVDMSDLGITITEGDFYAAMKQISVYPDCPPIGIDEGAGVNRSYSRTAGESWIVASYQDFMFKAHVYGMYFGDRTLAYGEVEIPETSSPEALFASAPKPIKGIRQQGKAKYTDQNGRALRNFSGYNVYRNGQKINDLMLPMSQCTYIDTPPYGGVHFYEVTTEYDEGNACPIGINIDVNSNLQAPENLYAEALGDSAHLWWNKANIILDWLYYDDGVYASSVGAGAAQFDVAVRIPVDVLATYNGFNLTTLRIYITTSGINTDYTGRVWTKEGINDPVLIAEIAIDEADIVWDAWNDYELETPLLIDATKELWFGYYMDEPDGDFAAAGSAVAIDGLGNMIYYNSAWTTLLELAPTLDYNWMVRAKVTQSGGGKKYIEPIPYNRMYSGSEIALTEIKTDTPQKTQVLRDDRFFLGYNVFHPGDDDPLNEEPFLDTNYYEINLEAGNYNYFVTANYTQGSSVPSDTVEVQILSSGQHFIPDWNGNPLNPMTITVNGAYLSDIPIGANDEIGIFDGDHCVGAAKLTQSIDPNDNNTFVYISCSADDPATTEKDGYTAGNPIIYKIWDNNAEEEQETVFVSYPYPAFALDVFTANETAVVLLNAYDHIQQNINLISGWNMISWNIAPYDYNLETLLTDLIDNDQLIKIQDESGQIMQHMPWGWVNNIGDMANTEGYYLKVNDNCTLSTTGSILALPYDIPLISGWNTMGWPAQNPALSIEALSELIDDDKLVKVIDEQGNVLEQFPWGWVNNIGNLQPGEGYQIKVNQACIFTANTSSGDHLALIPEKQLPTHYQTVSTGNPLHPMTFALKNDDVLPIGSEIAVYDGENCVGAAVVVGEYIYITASIDEDATSEIEGFSEGSVPEFRCYGANGNIDQKLNISYLEGARVFTKRGTFIGSLKDALDLEQALPSGTNISVFPNPARENSLLTYSLAEEAEVHIWLQNAEGKSLTNILQSKQTTGDYNQLMKLEHFAPGVYYLRIEFKQTDKTYNKSIRIIKI